MGFRLRIEEVWRDVLYGSFLGVGLRISIKPLGNDGEIDLSKEGG
jgi:hypothetical protein